MDIDSVDVFDLPRIPIKEKSRLPEQRGVYFVVKGNNVLYVGLAKNFKTRWANHHRYSQLCEMGAMFIAYYPVLEESVDIRKVEKDFIRKLKPKLNGMRNLELKLNELQKNHEMLRSANQKRFLASLAKRSVSKLDKSMLFLWSQLESDCLVFGHSSQEAIDAYSQVCANLQELSRIWNALSKLMEGDFVLSDEQIQEICKLLSNS